MPTTKVELITADSGKPVILEFVGLRQQPDVAEIFHAAIGASKHRYRLEFFGNDGLPHIGAQTRSRKIAENRQLRNPYPKMGGCAVPQLRRLWFWIPGSARCARGPGMTA